MSSKIPQILVGLITLKQLTLSVNFNKRYMTKAKKLSGKETLFAVVFAAMIMLAVRSCVSATTEEGSVNSQQQLVTNTISTCEQAKKYLEKAWDARDAVTAEEAMTTEGRAKWTKLRDAGVEARQLKEKLCGN